MLTVPSVFMETLIIFKPKKKEYLKNDRKFMCFTDLNIHAARSFWRTPQTKKNIYV